MWVSLRLMLIGSILGTLLGVAAGAYGAVRQYRLCDHLLTVFSFVMLSIPTVVLAVLVKNAGIGLNNLLGFTGDTKLLYTTGEITPGLDSWSIAGIIESARAPRAAVARADVGLDRVLRPLSTQRDARRARQRLPADRASERV